MPELVACPHCGCKVQVAELLLGRRTRCIACGETFVAGDPSPGHEDTSYPLAADGDEDQAPRPRAPMRGRMPLCPRCHRPVDWAAAACQHCNHLFDTNDSPDRSQPARDRDDHRGRLIDGLGSACLLCAGMGVCTAGAGLAAAFCVGVPALLMAAHDLARMRRFEVDPHGRALTEAGRNKAVIGLVLAVLLSVAIVLFYIDQISG